MLSSTFSLRAKTFHRLFVSPGKSDNLRRYYCVVPISEIPAAWANWLEVNARESTDKGKVPKAIRQTLTDKPEWFAEYNRGLTVVASSVAWDNKTDTVTLVFTDRDYNGVLDGGHTLRAILDQRSPDNGEDPQEGYCNLEIFHGLEEESITGVVEARNTSKQVASKSLMNLDGRFEEFKDALGSKSDLISWKENEEGELDVREFIAMLTALDADSYNDTNHPIIAYTGKEACLKRFAADENTPSYRKLLDIAPDIVEMWDRIQYCLPQQHNEKYSGRFGGLSGVKLLPSNKQKMLPFINSRTSYDIPTGYLYPILASFRAMLVEKDGYWHWGKDLDPMDLIDDGLAADIFEDSVRRSIDNYRNPNRTGKDAQAWSNAYLRAENFYLRQGG